MTTLLQLVDTFLDSLATGNRPNTIKTYHSALKHLIALESSDGAIDAALFQRYCKRISRYESATIANYLSSVSVFVKWLFDEKELRMSVQDYLHLQRTLKKARPKFSHLPVIITEEQYAALVAVASKPLPPMPKAKPVDVERAETIRIRNRAIVLFLGSSAARISELCSLKRGKLQTIHDKAGSEFYIALIRGKGNKDRKLLFDAKAWQALHAYFIARGDGTEVRSLSDLPVIAAHDRSTGKTLHRLSPQSAWEIIAKLGLKAGIKDLHPHSLRGYAITHFLNETHDLDLARIKAGHSSANTTQHYLPEREQELIAAHGQMYGISRLESVIGVARNARRNIGKSPHEIINIDAQRKG